MGLEFIWYIRLFLFLLPCLSRRRKISRDKDKRMNFSRSKNKKKEFDLSAPPTGIPPARIVFPPLVVLVPSHSMGGLLPFSFASLSTPSRDHASDYTRYIHRPGRTRKQVLRSIRAHLLTLSPSPSPSHPTPSCTPYLMNEITGR